jgi:hypothetical protein
MILCHMSWQNLFFFGSSLPILPAYNVILKVELHSRSSIMEEENSQKHQKVSFITPQKCIFSNSVLQIKHVPPSDDALPPSVHAVLDTMELLEAILSHLDCKDLAIVQAVSKTWRTLISRSITLRQNMFLSPMKTECRWRFEEQTNPLRFCFSSIDANTSTDEALEKPGKVVPIYRAHPLLAAKSPQDIHSIADMIASAFFVQMEASSMLNRCEDHSFSRMTITQPPMRGVVQNEYRTGHIGDKSTGFMCSRGYEVLNEKGVNFLDVAKEWLARGGTTGWRAGKQEKVAHTIRIRHTGSLLLNEKAIQALHEHDGHWVMAKADGSLGGNTN